MAGKAERRLSPNPDDTGVPLMGSTLDVYRGAGEFLHRFQCRADKLVISPEAYADICRRAHLMAMPQLWGYKMVLEERMPHGVAWRLQSADGSKVLPSTWAEKDGAA